MTTVCFFPVLFLLLLGLPQGQLADCRRERVPNLRDEEYARLMAVLSLPSHERTKEDAQVLRKATRYKLSCEEIHDPFWGQVIKRLTRNGRILFPPKEIDECILWFYRTTIGAGPEKICHLLRSTYFGISKNKIQSTLSKLEIHSQITRMFKNKAPLRPIPVSQVGERHQVDLVDLISLYKDSHVPKQYVLAVLDCFSRFLWLRAVTDKQSTTISDHLADLYIQWGPPHILQCDQGSEFKGAVADLAREFNIRLIRSRPRHPQSRGRVERPHATWKNKVRLLIQGTFWEDILAEHSWQRVLDLIAKNYNTGHHKAIKMTPYECLFGVKSNFIMYRFEGGDVQEDSFDEDVSLMAEAPSQKRILGLNIQRSQAAENSQKQENATEKLHAKKQKPSVYDIGEVVNVKVPGKDKGVKRMGLSLNRPKVYQGIVRDRKDHHYTIMLTSNSRKGEIVKTDVSSITSLTREEERGRQEGVQINKLDQACSKTTMDKLHDLISKEALGMDMLLENAAYQGLTLDSNNPGAGNCLFHALQQHLEKNGIKESHRRIRQEIVKFLSENVILGEGRNVVYFPDFVSGSPSYEDYLEQLQQDGVRGDNIVLLAAANLYHMSVWVVSSTLHSDPILIEPVSGISHFHIRLGHISELRYVTLKPQGVLCEYCGCQDENHNCSHAFPSEENTDAECDQIPFQHSTEENASDRVLDEGIVMSL